MKSRLNVRAVVAFAFCFFGCIVVLIMLGHNPLDIFVAIAFLIFLVSVGYAIDVSGLGKYFGGKP